MKFVRGVALLIATASRSTTTAFTVPAASSSSVVVAGSRFGAASVRQVGVNNNNNSLLIRNMATDAAEPRKAGVASPSELKEFVSSAGSNLLVVDVRHPDASVEPGDAKSLAVAGFPNSTTNYRPNAINLPWSRETNSMELPSESVSKDTPIITHCGGGGRGQKAKDYLESKGYTNVLNGGGPKETDCWAEYGDK